jgi:hypothetical protein
MQQISTPLAREEGVSARFSFAAARSTKKVPGPSLMSQEIIALHPLGFSAVACFDVASWLAVREVSNGQHM